MCLVCDLFLNCNLIRSFPYAIFKDSFVYNFYFMPFIFIYVKTIKVSLDIGVYVLKILSICF